jgi:hypothetical protein
LTADLATVPCAACGRVLSLHAEGTAWCSCGKPSRVFRLTPVRAAARPPAPVLAGTPCAYHAGNAAVTTCARCGSFVCTLCATPVGATTYCTACFERLHATGDLRELRVRIPRPHAWALAVALVGSGPYLVLVTAPVVVWLAVRAVRSRREIAERERGLYAYLAFTLLFIAFGLLVTGAIILATFAPRLPGRP